jgi:hypothetical protein
VFDADVWGTEESKAMNDDINSDRHPESDLKQGAIAESFVTDEPVWRKFLIPALIFVWPFIYFFRSVFPINGKYVAINNDFDTLYYIYKVYLLDNLSNGRIPMWSPSEAAGFPFASSPFTQTFYPLNLLLTIFYKVAGGYTRLDHQIFAISGVSIFGLGLYFWLKEFKFNVRSLLFATLVMSVSFKVAELLRFPNAIHTAAWLPWILFALTKILQSQSLKKAAKYGLLILFFLVCLLTAGYPYYVYYSLFLFGPYVLLFAIPKLRQKFFGKLKVRLGISSAILAVAGVSSLVICLPFLGKMSKLLKDTTDRGGGNFAYSTEHKFFINDTIGSLIFPPFARAEGWYYFGILGVFIILLYFFSELFGDSSKNAPWYRDRLVKISFLVFFITITYITYGRYSLLFKVLWQYMPGFASLRTWGRMNIILVPIIAWVMAIAYTYFEELITRRSSTATPRGLSKWAPIYVVTGAYVAILLVQSFVYSKKKYTGYWKEYFKNVASTDILFIIYGAIAFAIVLGILIVSTRIKLGNPKILSAIVAGLILFSALDMRNVGAFMWIYPNLFETPTRYRLNVAQQNLQSFTVPRADPLTSPQLSLSVNSSFNVRSVPNWHFNRYNKFLASTEDQVDARRKLLGVIDARKLYFSKAIDYPKIQQFLDDAAQFTDFEQVISYTGDELTLDVRAATDGYLSFIDNWDANWEATVDGKPTSIELLFGTFKSVKLPAGNHRVTFAYRPGLLGKK